MADSTFDSKFQGFNHEKNRLAFSTDSSGILITPGYIESIFDTIDDNTNPTGDYHCLMMNYITDDSTIDYYIVVPEIKMLKGAPSTLCDIMYTFTYYDTVIKNHDIDITGAIFHFTVEHHGLTSSQLNNILDLTVCLHYIQEYSTTLGHPSDPNEKCRLVFIEHYVGNLKKILQKNTQIGYDRSINIISYNSRKLIEYSDNDFKSFRTHYWQMGIGSFWQGIPISL